MDIVTVAGTGRHVASWRCSTALMPSGIAVCGPRGQQQRPVVRERDLANLPTFDPQRTSAPRRWGP
jgi:hypothetical protein